MGLLTLYYICDEAGDGYSVPFTGAEVKIDSKQLLTASVSVRHSMYLSNRSAGLLTFPLFLYLDSLTARALTRYHHKQCAYGILVLQWPEGYLPWRLPMHILPIGLLLITRSISFCLLDLRLNRANCAQRTIATGTILVSATPALPFIYCKFPHPRY